MWEIPENNDARSMLFQRYQYRTCAGTDKKMAYETGNVRSGFHGIFNQNGEGELVKVTLYMKHCTMLLFCSGI